MNRPRTTDIEELATVLEVEAQRAAAGDAEPEPEELLDLLAGRLSPEEESRLQRRIDASPEAARMLLDLADLEEATPASKDDPADLAVHAGWRDLQRRLATRESRPRRFAPILAAAAAALLVICAGLGYRVWTLQNRIDRPIGNLQSLDLRASRSGLGEPVELEPGQPLRLVLEPPDCPGSQPVYEADLGTGATGRVPGLRPDKRGLVSLLVRPEPGVHTLELFGCTPQRELGTYSFTIVRSAQEGSTDR